MFINTRGEFVWIFDRIKVKYYDMSSWGFGIWSGGYKVYHQELIHIGD